jgi:hypothetical protein
MLDSLYTTLFRPSEAPVSPSLRVAWVIWLLISLTEAMPFAGALSLGPGGLAVSWMVFFGLNVVGWFWLSAASNLLAQVMGGQGAAESTLTAVAQAFWPLILLPPLTAGQPWLGMLSPLLTFAILVWVYVGVAKAISRAHSLSMGRAILVLLLSGAAVGLGALAMGLMPILGILSALG